MHLRTAQRRRAGRLAASAAALPLLLATAALPAATAAHADSTTLTQAEIAALSGTATDRVIVRLAAQPANGSDRGHAQKRHDEVHQAQQPVLDELQQVGAKGVKQYALLPALAATVSPAEAAHLAARPDVAAVVPDSVVRIAPASPRTDGSANGTGGSPRTAACGTTAAPAQDEYLSTMHVGARSTDASTARGLGFTGSGVKVGFIADAIDPNNPDFVRPDGSHVVVDTVDFTGGGYSAPTSGGEAYIDSSAIAAQGRQIYDLSTYGPQAVPGGCYQQVQGVAPGASLVVLDAFGGDSAFNSTIAQAIDYATYVEHVDVLNESFGGNPTPDDPGSDLTRLANDNAVAAGITVTTSSGDAGVNNTQGSPSTDPAVIAVGASTTYQAFAQTGYGGAQFTRGGWESNNISTISSSGVDQQGRTIDLVAPGELNWSLCTADPSRFSGCANYAGRPSPVIAGGGTSQSAPLTAGAAALVIQAWRQAHGGSTPAPAQVKQLLVSTAQDLSAPGDQQGAGEVNAFRAVQAALGTGNALTVSQGQFSVVDQAGTSADLKEKVTNVSDSTQTLSVASRTLGAPATLATGSVSLSDTSSAKSIDYAGGQVNYEKVTLQVPPGSDRLLVDAFYRSSSTTASALSKRVRLTLVDPQDRIASYDLPQGNGNHDYAQVTSPLAGSWTLYVWSRTGARGGTVGTVRYEARTAQFTAFGTVSKGSFTLKPGQSRDVRLNVATPTSPGDQVGSLVLSTDSGPAFSRTSTVPVVLRTVASLPGTVRGTVVGGNGRSPFTGQTAYYQVDVPNKAPALTADLELGGDPRTTFYEVLVDPTGRAQAVGSNVQPTSYSDSNPTFQPGTQVHVLRPRQGRWTLIVNFYNQVAGTSLDEPYTVALDSTAPPVQASLPTGDARLTAGQAVTVPVTVTNTSASPLEYVVDGRLAGSSALPLAPFGPATVPVPGGLTSYVVPSHSTALAFGARSDRPVVAETSWDLGDPDLRASAGTTSLGTYAPGKGDVPAGFWAVIPQLVGPFPDGGTSGTTADTAMTVQTQPFDPAVSAPTGDLWQASVDPSAQIAPVVVQPGQSATIPVTFTPTAGKGTVRGTLYVVSVQLGPLADQVGAQIFGDDVAALPYQYTVG